MTAATPARACSSGWCGRGTYHLASGAKLPANTPALLWRAPRVYFGQSSQPPAQLRLTRIDGAEAVEVAITLEEQSEDLYLVRLPEELAAGARYKLSVAVDGSCAPDPVEFETGDAAPLPKALGRPAVATPRRDEVQLQTSSGSCYSPVPAVMAEADFELSAEAEPWADLLQFMPRVDGEPWRPSWTHGAPHPYEFENGQTLVFAECMGKLRSGREIDEYLYHQGLDEGGHSLRFEATLPGVDGVLISEEARFDLDCKADTADENPATSANTSTSPNGSCAAIDPGAAPASGSALALLLAGLLRRRSKRAS